MVQLTEMYGKLISIGFVIMLSNSTVLANMTMIVQTSLIKSIVEHFHFTSIILMSSNSGSFHQKITLEKNLNNPMKYFIGMWNFSTFSRNIYKEVSEKPSNTLVVIDYNEDNLKQLTTVSRKISITPYSWLIMSNLDDLPRNELDEISIPFNCLMIVSTLSNNNWIALDEVYKIETVSGLIIQRLGTWRLDKGFQNILNSDIYARRTDLQGQVLNYGLDNILGNTNPCDLNMTENIEKKMEMCVNYKLWNDFMYTYNFTTAYTSTMGVYLNQTEKVTHTVLDMIQRGYIDSGNVGFIMTSLRLEKNYFLRPVYSGITIFMTKVSSRKFTFESYIRPFVTSIWVALGGWLLFSGFLINIAKYLLRRTGNMNQVIRFEDVMENSLVPFSAICDQGSPSIPKEIGLRLIYLMVYMIPVIFLPSYSGSITSSLYISKYEKPFQNLQELENDGSYQVIAINNSFFSLLLRRGDQFESMRRKKLIPTTMPMGYYDSFQQICHKKRSLFMPWPAFGKNSPKCKVFIMQNSMGVLFTSMAVRKNYPYTELFNRVLQKLIDSGYIKRFLAALASRFRVTKDDTLHRSSSIKPLQVSDVMPLFTILFAGMIVSSIILLIEVSFPRRHKTKQLGNKHRALRLVHVNTSEIAYI